jgi:hypothetical protein
MTSEKQEKEFKLFNLYPYKNDWNYEWCINNWGTKWDVQWHEKTLLKNGIVYGFDTAWSPPIEWVKKVCTDFPLLTIKVEYNEPGAGFSGTFICKNEDIIKDFCKE